MHRSRINAFRSPKTWYGKSLNCGVWTSSGLEIGAHIAAVPSNGHDSRRAESRDYTKNQRLSEMTEVAESLQYRPFEGGIERGESCPGFIRAQRQSMPAIMHRQPKSWPASRIKEMFWVGLRS